MKKLRDIATQYEVVYDNSAALDRDIAFIGPGWYSLNHNNQYEYGEFATYSRIRVMDRTQYTYIHKDGTAVTEGHCIMPDSYEQTFTVKIRGLSVIGPAALKALIQTRHEIVAIDETHWLTICR